jgi:hypothetical protein
MQPMRALACSLLTLACTQDPDGVPACDERCEDGIAARALRETLKLAYNLTLQANPVGEQDETSDCPLGGRARVFGFASSNPVQGATEVDLTYELDRCAVIEIDEEANESYQMVIAGTLTQAGIMAVQPSATTALVMRSESTSLAGTVHDPPREYVALACAVEFGQNGNDLGGLLCGRSIGVDLGGGPN